VDLFELSKPLESDRSLERGIEERRRVASASTCCGEIGKGEPLKAAKARTEGLTMTLLLEPDERCGRLDVWPSSSGSLSSFRRLCS
jgi:hypothetical protein